MSEEHFTKRFYIFFSLGLYNNQVSRQARKIASSEYGDWRDNRADKWCDHGHVVLNSSPEHPMDSPHPLVLDLGLDFQHWNKRFEQLKIIFFWNSATVCTNILWACNIYGVLYQFTDLCWDPVRGSVLCCGPNRVVEAKCLMTSKTDESVVGARHKYEITRNDLGQN